jgi:hypothetical protein
MKTSMQYSRDGKPGYKFLHILHEPGEGMLRRPQKRKKNKAELTIYA